MNNLHHISHSSLPSYSSNDTINLELVKSDLLDFRSENDLDIITNKESILVTFSDSNIDYISNISNPSDNDIKNEKRFEKKQIQVNKKENKKKINKFYFNFLRICAIILD